MSKQNSNHIKKWTKTTSFLVPACGLDVSLLIEEGFVNAFLNDEKHSKTLDNVEDIYLLFKPDNLKEDFEYFCEVLRNHSNFLEEYDPIEGHVMFRFKLDSQWAHIKQELATSKYSAIDKEYVKEFFAQKVLVGIDFYGNRLYKDSVNYQILTKSPKLVAK